MEKASTKKEALLRDRDVRRWYDNLARGSPVTAEVNLRRLSLFCEKHGLTPKSLAALGRKSRRKLEDLVQDHVTEMERDGKSPGYIAGILKGLKSWLSHNDVELKRRIKIANGNATPSIEDERVPSKEELRAVLIYASDRAKASICLMAMAGLRPQSLGNESGTDGLTVGDLPEMKVHEDQVEFSRIPTMVVVRPQLSKARHRYFTFLPAEGCEYVAAYLNKRLANGEEFTPKTPIIAVNPGYEKMGKGRRNRGSSFIITKNIAREIREAIRKRFGWRPYVFRAYFDTQMLLAESHGRINHPYRVFFMGHKGDMEARYTTNKGRLPEDLIEDMRRAFSDSAEYLETRPRPEKERREMLLEMWRDQAKLYGIDPMKVKIEKEKELGGELSIDGEIQALQLEIQKRIPQPAASTGRDENTDCNGGEKCKKYESKLVAEDELLAHLNEGWDIVKELRNGKIVVRK